MANDMTNAKLKSGQNADDLYAMYQQLGFEVDPATGELRQRWTAQNEYDQRPANVGPNLELESGNVGEYRNGQLSDSGRKWEPLGTNDDLLTKGMQALPYAGIAALGGAAAMGLGAGGVVAAPGGDVASPFLSGMDAGAIGATDYAAGGAGGLGGLETATSEFGGNLATGSGPAAANAVTAGSPAASQLIQAGVPADVAAKVAPMIEAGNVAGAKGMLESLGLPATILKAAIDTIGSLATGAATANALDKTDPYGGPGGSNQFLTNTGFKPNDPTSNFNTAAASTGYKAQDPGQLTQEAMKTTGYQTMDPYTVAGQAASSAGYKPMDQYELAGQAASSAGYKPMDSTDTMIQAGKNAGYQAGGIGAMPTTLYDTYSKFLQDPTSIKNNGFYAEMQRAGNQATERSMSRMRNSGNILQELQKTGMGIAGQYLPQMSDMYRGGAQTEASTWDTANKGNIAKGNLATQNYTAQMDANKGQGQLAKDFYTGMSADNVNRGQMADKFANTMTNANQGNLQGATNLAQTQGQLGNQQLATTAQLAGNAANANIAAGNLGVNQYQAEAGSQLARGQNAATNVNQTAGSVAKAVQPLITNLAQTQLDPFKLRGT